MMDVNIMVDDDNENYCFEVMKLYRKNISADGLTKRLVTGTAPEGIEPKPLSQSEPLHIPKPQELRPAAAFQPRPSGGRSHSGLL